jgi:uncharacterized protein
VDLYSTLEGQRFVWDATKAAVNVSKHGVTFDRAREVFLDAFALFERSTVQGEQRWSCLGRDFSLNLLFVVHAEREADTIRIISARRAEAKERRVYEDE